jgi:hypothetical protein
MTTMTTMTTMTRFFQNIKSYMDDFSKIPTYSLQELKSNGIIYNSIFSSKKKAVIYAKNICDESSAVYIYKTYCTKIYDPVNNDDNDKYVDNDANDKYVDNVLDEETKDANYEPVTDLSNMTIWSYGKGYLLEPPEDSDYYGEKYFHSGWWMDTQKGWFFKKEHYQWLRDHGAIKATEDEQDEQDNTEIDLSNMTLWSYGKGWLLEPLQDNENYGQKYFHSGWWMSQQDAWFFKDEDYQWLIDNGAIKATEDDNDNDSDSTVIDLSNMKLTSYGKGWLLSPTSNDEHYGDKYFHEGWWMPKKNGWFFKDEHYQWLLEHDVNISKMTASNTTDKVSKNTTELSMYDLDLSNMALEEYKLGYILKTSPDDERYSQKYFMTGFWNNSQKGWFFKARYFDELLGMGAKFIKIEQDELLTNSTELSSSITNDSFEYVHDDSEFMTNENMAVPKFIKYGKGWVLKTDSNYKYENGLDYFEGGWWIPSIKGWFFKTDQKKEFMKKHFEI